MRKYWLAVLLIGGLLAWGLSWETPATADPSDYAMESDHGWGEGWGDTGFAKKIAGTYLTTFFFIDPEGEPNAAGSALMTIHSDGTFWTWSENAYGGVGVEPRRHDSPSIGTWERTGQDTIRGHGIIFAKNEETRAWSFIARQELVVDFSDEYNDVDIALETSIVLPSGEDLDEDGVDDALECVLFPPDPDTDACAWIGPFVGTSNGRRLHVLGGN